MRKTDLAWAAGLIDGEGCICIYRRKARGNTAQRHNLVLVVSMVPDAALRKLCLLFGGKINFKPARRLKQGNSWEWRVHQKEAQAVLKQLQPYLVTKLAEARLAIQFCDMPAATRWKKLPQNIIDAREEFCVKLSDMKPRFGRKGVVSL